MENQTFFQKWGTHLAYWTVIVALLAFFKSRPAGAVSEAAVAQVMRSHQAIAERERQAAEPIFNELKITSGRVHPTFDKRMDSLATATRNDCDELQMALKNAQQMLLENPNSSGTAEFWKNHAGSLQNLFFRLKKDFPQRVPDAKINFDYLLGIEGEQSVLEKGMKNASPDDLLLFCNTLTVNVEVLRHATYQSFFDLTKNAERWGVDFKLLADAPRFGAKIGEPWEARFYLCPVGVDARNVVFEVDGQPVSHSSNGVFFQKTFSQTGEQRLLGKASVRHPATGAVSVYSSEFVIPVQ